MPERPPSRPPSNPPHPKPGISRREAILLSLGQADQVALERERQSAIDAALGYPEPSPADPSGATASAPAPSPAPTRGLARFLPGFIRRRLTRER